VFVVVGFVIVAGERDAMARLGLKNAQGLAGKETMSVMRHFSMNEDWNKRQKRRERKKKGVLRLWETDGGGDL
jgi:hypothetical protein